MEAGEHLKTLRDLGLTLTRSYPYAHRVGLELEESRPEWRAEWAAAAPEVAALSLGQARGFAFLRWLEAARSPEELAPEIERALESGALSEGELRELRNTAEWYAARAEERRGEKLAELEL